MGKNLKALPAFILLSLIVNCAPARSSSELGQSLGDPPSQNNGGAGQSSLKICSKLDFSKATFPTQILSGDRAAFELGLNVTGSFEGDKDWANLSNNFDGVGMSMGLLNQNFGSGTLQPLLIEMRDKHLSIMQSIFSAANLNSLLQMLSSYQSVKVHALNVVSLLDLNPGLSVLTVPISQSVSWALSNLYNGTAFKPDWAAQLTALGQTPEYISIQLEAAASIHQRAVQYVQFFQVNEIRSYLLAFDIVVQNGSLSQNDIQDYKAFLAASPMSPATVRLTEIVSLRLRQVLAKYVADVRSRKMTTIDGKGYVHGVSRNLESEYCFNRLLPYH